MRLWSGTKEGETDGEREDEAVTRMNIHMFRGPENTENTYVLLIPAAESYFLLRSQPHYNSFVPAVVLKDIWWHTKIGNTHEFQKRGSINEHKSEIFSDQAFISFGRSRLPQDENRPR